MSKSHREGAPFPPAHRCCVSLGFHAHKYPRVCWRVKVAPSPEISPVQPLHPDSALPLWAFSEITRVKLLAQISGEANSILSCSSFWEGFMLSESLSSLQWPSYLSSCARLRWGVRLCWDSGPYGAPHCGPTPPIRNHDGQGVGTRSWVCPWEGVDTALRDPFCFPQYLCT